MSEGEVTIPPVPRRRVNLRAEELLSAIVEFLRQKGTHCSVVELDPGVGCTTVLFHEVVGALGPWGDGRYVFFTVYGRAFRTLSAKIGGGPFELTILKSLSIEEARQGQACLEICDVVAVPNNNRSITFRPIVKRENGKIFY